MIRKIADLTKAEVSIGQDKPDRRNRSCVMRGIGFKECTAVKVSELKEALGAKVLNEGVDLSGEVRSAYVCDLLSWVMAKAAPATAWITVMNHMNVIAVATLLDMACVVIPENIPIERETLDKAAEEGIPVLSSEKTAYEIAGILYKLGLSNPVR